MLRKNIVFDLVQSRFGCIRIFKGYLHSLFSWIKGVLATNVFIFWFNFLLGIAYKGKSSLNVFCFNDSNLWKWGTNSCKLSLDISIVK